MAAIPRWIVTLLPVCVKLALFSTPVDACMYWPSSVSQEPAIGFDLNLNHGASVASFPNGTFANLAYVQGSDVYEAWMHRALDEAITPYLYNYRSPWGAASVSKGWVYIQELFLQRGTAPADEPDLTSDVGPLIDLVGKLKKETEARLGHSLSRVATSYPSFFTTSLTSHLARALQNLSLSDDGCHGDARSSVASLVAHRQAELDLRTPTRPLDCIHGQPGVENVVHIENTEQYLAITAFEFFVEQHTAWAEESFARPTYLKKPWNSTDLRTKHSQDNDTDSSTNSESDFWAVVQECLDHYFSEEWDSREEAIYRLVLTGSKADEPALLQTLQNTRNIVEMRPQLSPVVLHVVRDKAKISRLWAQRYRAITCPPNDQSYMWGGDLWGDYGEHLLALVSKDTRRVDDSIDPRFAAARGAALYALESRVTACNNHCDMNDCREKRRQVDLERFCRDWYEYDKEESDDEGSAEK